MWYDKYKTKKGFTDRVFKEGGTVILEENSHSFNLTIGSEVGLEMHKGSTITGLHLIHQWNGNPAYDNVDGYQHCVGSGAVVENVVVDRLSRLYVASGGCALNVRRLEGGVCDCDEGGTITYAEDDFYNGTEPRRTCYGILLERLWM